ncbi:hypothetical protein FO519_003197 [Halicephalobus sp. NKZ332]|nr:hypothetical protein FO519_003197 [Halicephalobus sp. NKZ332]
MTEVNEDEVKNEVDEFEDDEFGDFEEASVSAAPLKPTMSIEEPDDPFPQSPRTENQFGFAKFDEKILKSQSSFESFISSNEQIKSLSEVADDPALWDFEDSAADSVVEKNESITDFFEHFDTGKFPEEDSPDLPDFYLKALKLWSEICFVEDTPALKLQWNKTNLYSGLLSTLNMNPAKAVPREKPVLPTLIPTSAPLELPSHDRVSKIQSRLNLDEILRPTTGRIGNGNLAELSADAKSLLEALPDYGHMLSRMLMFPVKR